MRLIEAFRIIQPVDADRKLFAVQAAAQPRDVWMGGRFCRQLGEFSGIDADRKHRGAGAAVARRDDAVMHGEAEIGLRVGQKVLAVFLGLEADEIIGQHRLDQFAMMRHARHHRARRPRRVQEEADRLGDAEIAQLGAEREKVIILDPERGVGFAESQQRARHEGVDFAVAEIIFLRGADQIGARMQRRPQSRIGETFVIAAVMRRRQIQHRQRTGTQCFDFGKRFLLVPVADSSAGTNPDRT